VAWKLVLQSVERDGTSFQLERQLGLGASLGLGLAGGPGSASGSSDGGEGPAQ
jgi:hypothetical protein